MYTQSSDIIFTLWKRFGKIQVHLNKIMLFIASLTLVTCWTIYRKESFAWILLDIVSFTTR